MEITIVWTREIDEDLLPKRKKMLSQLALDRPISKCGVDSNRSSADLLVYFHRLGHRFLGSNHRMSVRPRCSCGFRGTKATLQPYLFFWEPATRKRKKVERNRKKEIDELWGQIHFSCNGNKKGLALTASLAMCICTRRADVGSPQASPQACKPAALKQNDISGEKESLTFLADDRSMCVRTASAISMPPSDHQLAFLPLRVVDAVAHQNTRPLGFRLLSPSFSTLVRHISKLSGLPLIVFEASIHQSHPQPCFTGITKRGNRIERRRSKEGCVQLQTHPVCLTPRAAFSWVSAGSIAAKVSYTKTTEDRTPSQTFAHSYRQQLGEESQPAADWCMEVQAMPQGTASKKAKRAVLAARHTFSSASENKKISSRGFRPERLISAQRRSISNLQIWTCQLCSTFAPGPGAGRARCKWWTAAHPAENNSATLSRLSVYSLLHSYSRSPSLHPQGKTQTNRKSRIACCTGRAATRAPTALQHSTTMFWPTVPPTLFRVQPTRISNSKARNLSRQLRSTRLGNWSSKLRRMFYPKY